MAVAAVAPLLSPASPGAASAAPAHLLSWPATTLLGCVTLVGYAATGALRNGWEADSPDL